MSSGSKHLKIFAHDAGSGNATFAFAKQAAAEGYEIEAYALGPSEQIFQREISGFVRTTKPNFQADDLVVTGLSGIHSKFELEMVKAAREAGVRRIISIMDIPFNLDLRFMVDGKFLGNSYLPDEIWVSKIAEHSANPEIQSRLVVKPNPYWDYVKKTQYGAAPSLTQDFIRQHQSAYVLYLTDYISEQYGDSLGFTEFSVLEHFLKTHARICPKVPVLLRHHPAEKKGKYDKLLALHPDLIYSVSSGPLNEAVWYSTLVCGSLSSVFYESTLIGKPTLSLQFGAVDVRRRAPDGVTYLGKEEELEPALRSSLTSVRS